MTMIEQAMDSQGHESIQKDTREEHNASASKSVLVKGINGNASITLYADGTRIIDYPGEDAQIIDLEYPLNVDIKLSSRCAFGMDPRTQKAVCSFCHESARTDGIEGDYERLETILSVLPLTTKIALGINEVTEDLIQFLSRLKQQGRIVNGTFNQGLIRTGAHRAITDQKLLNGIGISWRRASWGIDDPIYLDPNTVLHVIAGIDDFDEISDVIKAGAVRKLLILGEKDFGFNQGNVDIKSPSHLKWQKKSCMSCLSMHSFPSIILPSNSCASVATSVTKIGVSFTRENDQSISMRSKRSLPLPVVQTRRSHGDP